ncbi:MAG TPA: hypothetical protein VIN39_06315 [Candidatus Dormibacteraeota bacterium]
MSRRLLGVIPHVEDLPALAGRAFGRYAAAAVEITVACAGGADLGPWKGRARSLGIHNLIVLDYRHAELDPALLAEILADIMRGVQPHVVVASGEEIAVFEGAQRAFRAARLGPARSGAVPAKLYRRVLPGTVGSAVTTAVPTGLGSVTGAERFVRVFPSPWVTGVLERDLFAGIGTAEPPAELFGRRLAS